MDMFGETDTGSGADAPTASDPQSSDHAGDCGHAPMVATEPPASTRPVLETLGLAAAFDGELSYPDNRASLRRFVDEAPIRRAARGPVTMQVLDDACETIDRLGLPREEVERRWPHLAVVILSIDRAMIERMNPEDPPPLDEARVARERARLGLSATRADFDRLRSIIAAARPDVVAADGGRVVVADLKTASRAHDELSRALAHELAPEPRPRRPLPWEILVLATIAAAALGLALRCG